jgi:hypothetical protein
LAAAAAGSFLLVTDASAAGLDSLFAVSFDFSEVSLVPLSVEVLPRSPLEALLSLGLLRLS